MVELLLGYLKNFLVVEMHLGNMNLPAEPLLHEL